jgi:hypothetical protein
MLTFSTAIFLSPADFLDYQKHVGILRGVSVVTNQKIPAREDRTLHKSRNMTHWRFFVADVGW